MWPKLAKDALLVESDADWACVDKETATILVKALPVGGQIAKVGDHP